MGCLKQHFRPSEETKIRVPGAGECWKCIEHEDNKNCRLYHKITAPNTFEVKEKEDAIHKNER